MHSRLTHIDGSFLRVETPNAHMHVAWSGLFAPPPDGPRPTVEWLREKVESRLHLVPRFRQRVAAPPLGLTEPAWIDDPLFDVRRHVSELGAAPLPLAAFRRLTDEALSRPLRRNRPLWHIHLAPELEDGRVGLLFKIHHALVDGKSAVELALLLFDTTPDAAIQPGACLVAGAIAERRPPGARRLPRQRGRAAARGPRAGPHGHLTKRDGCHRHAAPGSARVRARHAAPCSPLLPQSPDRTKAGPHPAPRTDGPTCWRRASAAA